MLISLLLPEFSVNILPLVTVILLILFFFFLIGVCTVRILNNEQYVEPAYVYYALGTFKKGIPCRSTMFNVYGDRFTDRPDEIAIQQCNMSCKLNS